jgi:hypothetical protein
VAIISKKLSDAGHDYREDLRKAVTDRNNLINIAKTRFKKARKAARERYLNKVRN